MTHKHFWYGCCLILIALATGCQPKADTRKIIQIGSTKADLFGLPKEFRALHPRLEELFGMQIIFRAQPNGEALGHQLAQGNIAFAFMSAKEYCQVTDPSKITLLATGLNALGKPSRKAYIVVKAHSHVKTIQDIAGKRFAFGDYEGLLTDYAARDALAKAGVPLKKLLPELLLPPPIVMEARLYRGHGVAQTIVLDITVNAGVIDELDYEKMPDSGGNVILGPSKDQLEIVGETIAVPEVAVVAGPAASPEQREKLKNYLLNHVQNDERICKQLGVTGFTKPDESAYDQACALVKKKL